MTVVKAEDDSIQGCADDREYADAGARRRFVRPGFKPNGLTARLRTTISHATSVEFGPSHAGQR